MAVKTAATITLYTAASVTAVYRYYKMQLSDAAAPAKPTAKPGDPQKEAPSGWEVAEPAYTTGRTNSLYTVDLNLFSDGTFQYSNVSLSSSYEAAKKAYNEAVETARRLVALCMENDTTYINGAKIYTGTVGAKQINVEDLFAQDITASGTITGSILKGAMAELLSGKIGPFALSPEGLSSTLDSRIEYTKRDVSWASAALKWFEENGSIVAFSKSLSVSNIDSCTFTADKDTITSNVPAYKAIDVDGNIVSSITAVKLVPVFLVGTSVIYAGSFSALDITNAKQQVKARGASSFRLGLQVRVAGTTSTGTVVNPTIKIKWAAQNQQVYRNQSFTDDLLSTFNPKASISVNSVDMSMTVDGFKFGALSVYDQVTNISNTLRVNDIDTYALRLNGNNETSLFSTASGGIHAFRYINDDTNGFSCPALYIRPASVEDDKVNRMYSYNWTDDPTDYDDPLTDCGYEKIPFDIVADELRVNGKSVVDMIYPVGSIYLSVNNVNPKTLFGGTWEQIKDKFLLAAGGSYSAGTTGGSADAVVVSHNHTMPTFRQKSGGVASGSTYKWIHYDTGGGGGIGTSTNGESGTGKNMPPYLVVYMWKRTA